MPNNNNRENETNETNERGTVASMPLFISEQYVGEYKQLYDCFAQASLNEDVAVLNAMLYHFNQLKFIGEDIVKLEVDINREKREVVERKLQADRVELVLQATRHLQAIVQTLEKLSDSTIRVGTMFSLDLQKAAVPALVNQLDAHVKGFANVQFNKKFLEQEKACLESLEAPEENKKRLREELEREIKEEAEKGKVLYKAMLDILSVDKRKELANILDCIVPAPLPSGCYFFSQSNRQKAQGVIEDKITKVGLIPRC